VRVTDVETIAIREPEPLGDPGWHTGPRDAFLPPFERPASGVPQDPERVTNVIVRLSTDEGLDGLGTVGVGSPAAVAVIEHHLRPLVVGESPFDVELLWERMFRSTLNLGRKGLVLEAISAIDIALWDIMGKATGQPVYNLLGGRTRRRIRAYVSQSYAYQDLARVREEAAGFAREGFTALKMRFGYGPTDGRPGMRKNHELVGAVREAVGPDVEIAADAYMGWDATYAIAMIRALEEFELAWVEEPVPPDDVDGYVRVRSAVNTPISGGEHEFTRWGFRELLQRGAVDIVQPDVNRMGGITEARKVWALASAFNTPVIPHSPQAHNAHLIAAHLNSPLIEYFPQGTIRGGYIFYAELFRGEPEAHEGFVELSDRPGLGIELDEAVIERYRADRPAVPERRD
jgi:L-rhamnonate dehydratase